MERLLSRAIQAGVAATMLALTAGPAEASRIALAPYSVVTLVAGGCKQAVSCEDAVRMWCGGYRRADGDGDGIPCENVCHSLEEVERIRNEIGC